MPEGGEIVEDAIMTVFGILNTIVGLALKVLAIIALIHYITA